MAEPLFVLLGVCLLVLVTTFALEYVGSQGGARLYLGYFALGAAPLLAFYHLLIRREPLGDVLGLLAILAAAASGSFTARHVDRRRRERPRGAKPRAAADPGPPRRHLVSRSKHSAVRSAELGR